MEVKHFEGEMYRHIGDVQRPKDTTIKRLKRFFTREALPPTVQIWEKVGEPWIKKFITI